MNNMFFRFEVTSELDGEILAEKFGAFAFSTNQTDSTIDGFVYLRHKILPKEQNMIVLKKGK